MKRTYLGDGLYVEDHGFQFILIAPRQEGEHYVALEPDVLDSFLSFIEKHRGVKITIEPAPEAEGSKEGLNGLHGIGNQDGRADGTRDRSDLAWI